MNDLQKVLKATEMLVLATGEIQKNYIEISRFVDKQNQKIDLLTSFFKGNATPSNVDASLAGKELYMAKQTFNQKGGSQIL